MLRSPIVLPVVEEDETEVNFAKLCCCIQTWARDSSVDLSNHPLGDPWPFEGSRDFIIELLTCLIVFLTPRF